MTTQPLAFVPSPRLRRYSAVAALAVAAAVVTANGELAVLAVAPLVLLALSPRSALPRTARVAAELGPLRCVEDDELTLTLRVEVAAADRVDAKVGMPAHAELRPVSTERSGDATTARWVLVPRRWGRYRTGPVQVRVLAGHGLYVATLELPLDQIVVYPGSGSVARAVAPSELPARLGEHASRAVGSGVEYGGVRPYAPGDRRRDVDWRTSARHQRLFVRQYAADRAFDLVVLLDVGVDAGEPGRSTLDFTVRAATGLAQSYLAVHDRVGIITLGGSTRWITPASGARQLHRVAESVMEVRLDSSEVGGGLDRVPPSVLPSGAFVCVLSPLLDDRVLTAVRDLRERGLGLLVVDVLNTEPSVGRHADLAALALRVWRMHRESVRVELARLGVPLLRWEGSGDLSGPLLHAMRALRPGVRA